MAQTLEMFEKPRKPREWLMHVSDCMNGNGWAVEGLEQVVTMKCYRCGHETDWISMPNVTVVKRGIPCPKCNIGQTQNASTIIKDALNHADRREYLCKNSRTCPECSARQVQLINQFAIPAEWKCRRCKTKFKFEPDTPRETSND
jgi:DNA-directed RNA polymerase subunit RPC12/RpoP